MRVLFLVTVDWSFLSQRFALASALRDMGVEVHVASASTNKVAEIEALGFRHHHIPFDRKGTNPFYELCTVWAIIRLFRQLRPDLVHNIALKPVLLGTLASWFVPSVRVVSTVTGLGYLFIGQSRGIRLLSAVVQVGLRLLLRRPHNHVVFQNPDDLNFFLLRRLVLPKNATLILGSGVDLNKFRFHEEVPREVPIIVFPARMLRDKGLVEYISALRLLRERGIAFEAWLVGDVDHFNPTSMSREEVKSWVDEKLVLWQGHCSDMPQVFATSHLVVLPSYREGLPLSLAEAAAVGRAIVTTDTPGCRETVREGVSGLLVPVRSVETLAKAMETLLLDKELRQRFGRAGREHAEKLFGRDVMVAKTCEVYEHLTGKKCQVATAHKPARAVHDNS